jgi:hypothetical protein
MMRRYKRDAINPSLASPAQKEILDCGLPDVPQEDLLEVSLNIWETMPPKGPILDHQKANTQKSAWKLIMGFFHPP